MAISRVGAYLAVGSGYLVLLFLFDRLGGRLQGPLEQGIWNPFPGLSLALLFLFGLRYLPFLAVRPWVSPVWVFQQADGLLEPLVFAMASMAPYAAAAWTLRSSSLVLRCGMHPAGLVVFTAVGLAAAAADAALTLGYAGHLGLLGERGILERFPDLWMAGGLGVVSLAPLLWALRREWDRRRTRGGHAEGGRQPAADLAWGRGGVIEAVLQAMAVLLAFWVAFAAPSVARKPYYYLFFIPLVWIALHRGILAASAAVLAVNAGILFAVGGGQGLSPDGTDLRVFLLVLTLSILFLGARTSESLGARARTEFDPRLLDVVRRIQARFIRENNLSRELLEELLRHLLDLSGSRYGILCEVDEEDPERVRVVADNGWDAARGVLLAEAVPDRNAPMPLRRFIAERVAARRPVLINDVRAELTGEELPEGASSVRNILVLPLVDEGMVVGLLGLADRPGGFDQAIAGYLEPVLGASADLIAAYRRNRRREREERELHAGEQRFRQSVEGVRDYAILTLDPEGRISSWNLGAERIKGYSAAEAIGKSYSIFFGEKDRAAGLPEAILAAARREGAYRDQGWRIRKDGTAFFADVRVTAIREADGSLLGFSKVTRDVTEYRAMESRARDHTTTLEDRARELDALLDVVPIGVAFMDAGRKELKSWNPAFARLFRLEGMPGDPIPASGPVAERGPRLREEGQDIATGEGPLYRAVSLGRPVLDRQLELRFPDGEARTLLVSAVPLSDGAGKVRGGVGLYLDVTEKLRAGAALERTSEELRQSRKLEEVGRIAGGVAHDFNNLLTAINGYADLALSALPEDAPVRAYLAEIHEAGDRAADLTRQLLVFTRRQERALRPLDVNAIVEGMVELLRRVIPETIRIRTSLDPGTGAVLAERNQVERIILNLGVNARDAMPMGGTLTLETRKTSFGAGQPPPAGLAPGEYVVLGLKDTGTGIREADRARVFEPFFTTKPEGKGTGLGLSMVRQMTEDMGGGVDFESVEGRGTRFQVYLPAALPVASAPAMTAASSGSGPASGVPADPDASASQAPTILVVDDEEPVRTFVRLVLEGKGYKVLEASGGEEALRLSEGREGRLDMLLTDVVMPGMGGRELAGRLKGSRPELPVVFMSGYTDDVAIRQGFMEPYATLLPKPFTPAVLLERVRAALGAAARR